MDGIKSSQLKMGLCGLAAVGLMLATQGCSSSSNSGAGGSTGGGGSAGKGGSTGQGGTTGGQGGAIVDSGPPLCTGIAWPGTGSLITDFSDAQTDAGATILLPGKGGIYTYGTSAVVESGHLHVTGNIVAGSYSGVGIYFNDCINGSSYTGYSFVLTGSLGTCDMAKLAALFPQIQPPPPGSGHGVCTGTNCYGPGATYTTATTMVAFASMLNGGAVATVTAEAQSRLTGIDFGFHGPAGSDAGGDASAGGCTVDFTIDDVKFTP